MKRETTIALDGKVDRFGIARLLEETGDFLELGPERFKAKAYSRGARSLLQVGGDLDLLIRQGRLTELGGIGKALASQIEEIHRTGRSSLLEKLRSSYPPGTLELAQVASLSLAKIKLLSGELGIKNLAELKAAAETGKLKGVKGFGPKTEKAMLASIALLENSSKRTLLLHALISAGEIIQYISLLPDVKRVELAGTARRFHETVSELVFVASSRAPAAVIGHFLDYPFISDVKERSPRTCTVKLADSSEASLVSSTQAEFPTSLLYATGSAAHVGRLEAIAEAKKLRLTIRNLKPTGGAKKDLKVKSEADIYHSLALGYIPPELREDDGEIEAARRGKGFDLVRRDDIRGLIHCHTTYSDGKHSVEEMALAAEAMGVDYLTITDHSPTAFYAGGLKLDRLKAQWEEIDRVQERVKIRLLRGTESDILGDGALDYPDPILERFDIIIASIHARLKMDEDAMTRRVLNAIRQPQFKIWGHPLGRLLERRPPFNCRVEEVLDAIAESRAAIEINGDPHRLDLEPRWIKEARKRSIKFVISTDAHSMRGLENVRFGVGIARRGGVRKSEVLNALAYESFKKAVKP